MNIGEGRENFSEEKLSLPSPNPIPPFPKTFGFIESPFDVFPINKKSRLNGIFSDGFPYNEVTSNQHKKIFSL
ncbi:hypothetical protein WCP94_004369 [Bilophila wadsworthia]|uniref:hypothetical protein n=1 Tax=Bilophila wadsworthia TaxID=35833 RepID=UPI003D6FFC4F